ncbi:MAG: DUF1553 domain-containing protein [Planctomycetota bacterium]|nr:DUF1553 domain-containing protein [Planctomycetota bacterium]
MGDGRTRLAVEVSGSRAEVEVLVEGSSRDVPWSFRNHVLAVLAKSGCNSGACHGAIAGQNGFRLSLRGYDPEGDFESITRHARGRRIVLSDPGLSLLLRKPTGAVKHKGGVRFAPDSREYRVVAGWIAAGASPPRPADPRLTELEVFPSGVLLRPGDEQQLVVLAHFDDGHVEDVTSWVKYSATNSAVARVDDAGVVTVVGAGEGAVTAWYLSHIVVATVVSPFPNDVPEERFTGAPSRNFIDELVLRKLRRLNLPPSPPATDAVFIRRAFVDTIGLLPTAQETRAFLADSSPGKWDALIERLLERPEFVDYWTYWLSDLLLVSSERLRPPAMWSYYGWIRGHVTAGTPWDRLVRELVTARGSTLENGATNFFVLHEDAAGMAETVSVAFLGMSIGCARCHNHPLEKWTNDQYYAMANLFARVRQKNAPGDGNRVVFSAETGDIIQPLTGRPQAPAPLDAPPMSLDTPGDRRPILARWLTSPENPCFARAIANRVWANFLGVGLVEKVDDMRLTNPPSSEELLSALARHLVARKFDLRDLMRTILRSSTYQRSSTPLEQNVPDTRFYSRYFPRRLMAEVLLDAISRATDVPTAFAGYPEGWRALQLPDSRVASYFLSSFGRPERKQTCSCERTAEPSVAQVLHIANGDTLNAKLAAKGGLVDRLVRSGHPDYRIVEEAYLSSLSRYPTDRELRRILDVFAAAKPGDKRKVVEDLLWSLVSSREFLFNH